MAGRFYQSGLRFECTQCSACCRFNPGYIFLTRKDLDQLCLFMGMPEKEFIERFCRWVDQGSRTLLSLKEKKNYDCIFWDQGCTVYQSRPLQCRTYPFWKKPLSSLDHWKLESRFCPGIGKGKLWSAQEIEEIMREKQETPILEKKDFENNS